MPAGSGTFMLLYYSGGLFGVHNVEALSTQALPGYLDLSNTSFPQKTLSISKPPHVKVTNVTFQDVPDGKAAPGKGIEEPFRVPFTGFRTVPRTVPAPSPTIGPVPIQPLG